MDEQELKIIEKSLMRSGVSSEYIESIKSKLSKKDTVKNKPIFSNRFSKIVYWLALLITIFGNFMMSVVLVPFLVYAEGAMLYVVICIFGLFMGFIFQVLLRDIENLDYQHHIMAGLFLPVMAIINVYIMAQISNVIESMIVTHPLRQDPLTISFTYFLSFMLPYSIYQIFRYAKKR